MSAGRLLVDRVVTFAAASYTLVSLRTLGATCLLRHGIATDSGRIPRELLAT